MFVLSPKAKNSKTQAQPQSDEAQSPKYSGPFQPYKPFYEERVQLGLFSDWLLGMIQILQTLKIARGGLLLNWVPVLSLQA